jgi:hypothetical protein
MDNQNLLQDHTALIIILSISDYYQLMTQSLFDRMEYISEYRTS